MHRREIALHVESLIRTRSGFAVLLFFSLGVFLPVAGCRRAPGADVVATVNGKEILRSDLDRYFQATLGDNSQKLSPVEAAIRRMQVLHQMIQDEILQQQAAKENLAATDEDVNARLTEIKAPYTQDEFYNQLKQRNLTLDDFKRQIRRTLTTNKLLNKEIESRINITDAQITAYYNQHKAEFDFVEPQYHLAEIVVTTSPAQQAGNLQNSKATGAVDAKKKIDALHNRLESGEDFSALAMNFSEDPNTASNGGDMGFVAESALRSDPEIYAAVGQLKPDQFTGVLSLYDSQGPSHKLTGYAIFKLIGREPAGQRELSDPRVQQTIHGLLHESEKQLLQTAYFEMLQNQAKVRNYYAEQILKQGAP